MTAKKPAASNKTAASSRGTKSASAAKNSAAKKNTSAAEKPAASGRGRVTALASQHATQAAMNKYKMEAAQELGIDLDGPGKLTRRQAGQIGGHVVRKMVAAYENGK